MPRTGHAPVIAERVELKGEVADQASVVTAPVIQPQQPGERPRPWGRPDNLHNPHISRFMKKLLNEKR